MKKKQPVNEWIDVKDYQSHRMHVLVLNDGKSRWVCYNRKIVLSGRSIMDFLKEYDVKRVMILRP